MEQQYAEYAWERAAALLAIDSPTGYTEQAAEWVQTAFDALGFAASRTVKGGVLGLAATIFGILAFAVAVKQFGLSDMVISAVNQAIKVGSIFLAAYAAAKSSPENKLLAGAGAGAAYVILGYLAFSLIQSRWGKVRLLLADLGMGLVIGALTAIIFARLGAEKTKRA